MTSTFIAYDRKFNGTEVKGTATKGKFCLKMAFKRFATWRTYIENFLFKAESSFAIKRERKESRIELMRNEMSLVNIAFPLTKAPKAENDSHSGDKSDSNRADKTVLSVGDERRKKLSLQRQAGGSLTAMTVQ